MVCWYVNTEQKEVDVSFISKNNNKISHVYTIKYCSSSVRQSSREKNKKFKKISQKDISTLEMYTGTSLSASELLG